MDYYWQHAGFPCSTHDWFPDQWRAFRAYRELQVHLVPISIGQMPQAQERELVTELLTERYGSELVPSESVLGFPGDRSTNDPGRWQVAFDTFKSLYGTSVGTARRLGKDLHKYRTSKCLLSEPAQFERCSKFAWRAVAPVGSGWLASVQEFPREHLYRLDSGEATILEFDDWPPVWERSW